MFGTGGGTYPDPRRWGYSLAMAHCPQCGSAVAEGGTTCPACGAAATSRGSAPGQRTLLGTADLAPGSVPVAPEPGAKVAAQTIVGMPVSALPVLGAASEAAKASGAGPAAARTILGMPVPASVKGASGGVDPGKTSHLGSPVPLVAGLAKGDGAAPVEPSSAAARTLLGVARPGIAPLDPMAKKPSPPLLREVEPAQELGATIGGSAASVDRAQLAAGALGKRMAGFDRGRLKAAAALGRAGEPKPAARRGTAVVIIAAGLLAVGAVLFAVLWRSAPPLSARATVDATGKEVLEVRCESCPDGTIVEIGSGKGEISGGEAIVAADLPLSVGDNQMRVAIDRPGNGRDEEVHLSVQVSYRVRPDLSPLLGQRPSLQVVVEAIDGTHVEIDGREVPLVGGRAVHTVDVTEALSGPQPKASSLERRVSYSIRPPGAEVDHGEVAISVGIVPLTLFAPGPSIVIDEPTFVLAGRTQRGAEITAAGKPIPLKPDGTFAQVMNVSSVGATQIEVRATLPEKAPRLMKVDVRRVDTLKAAEQEFERRADRVPYSSLAADIDGNVGKSVAIVGEVAEARRENHQTIALVDVSRASGCASPGASACQVRLVAGFDRDLRSGVTVRAYGRVARAFTIPSRSAIPEVDVEFIVEGRP